MTPDVGVNLPNAEDPLKKVSMENIKCGKYESPSITLVKGYLYDYPIPDGVGRDWYKFEIIQHTCPVDKITQTSFDYDLNTHLS